MRKKEELERKALARTHYGPEDDDVTISILNNRANSHKLAMKEELLKQIQKKHLLRTNLKMQERVEDMRGLA